MIKIEAIIREERLHEVIEALNKIEVHGITVYQVMGCGTQKGYKEYVRGIEVDIQLLPKVKLEILVSSEEWELKTIETIQKAAFTGSPGDGKIISSDVKNAMRIRTGETGSSAIQPEI